MAQQPVICLWSVLFLALLSLFFGLLMKRLARGYLLITLVVVILNLINYFKTLITSMPLELPDLKLAGQVGAIAQLNPSPSPFQPQPFWEFFFPSRGLLCCAFWPNPCWMSTGSGVCPPAAEA